MGNLTLIEAVKQFEKANGVGWSLPALTAYLWDLQQAGELNEPWFATDLQEQAILYRNARMGEWLRRNYLYVIAEMPAIENSGREADSGEVNLADVPPIYRPIMGHRRILAWLERQDHQGGWRYGTIENIALDPVVRQQCLEHATAVILNHVPSVVYSQAVNLQLLGGDLDAVEAELAKRIQGAFQEAKKVTPLGGLS